MTIPLDEKQNSGDGEIQELDTNQNINKNQQRSKTNSCFEIFIHKLLSFRIELIVFILYFCYSLSDALSFELILKRTCLKYGYSEDNCSDAAMPVSIRNVVHIYSANIVLAITILEALFPAILSLFIGPWMDKNGRKPFVILPIVGMLTKYTLWLIISYIHSLPSVYYVIPSFPISLAGGMIAFQACAYCYLADTISVELRTIRMSILALFMGLGVLCGYLLAIEYSAKLTDQLPLATFGTSIFLLVITLVFVIFLVPETIHTNVEDNSSLIKKVATFFNLEHIKESTAVLFKSRSNQGRIILLLMVSSILLTIIIEQGESTYRYLTAKAAYAWSLQDYNNYRSTMTGIAIVIGIIGLYILKRILKLSDMILLEIVTVLQLISSIVVALSKTTLIFTIGSGFGVFLDINRALAKTKISFLVLSTEIGKTYVIISTLEAIAPLVASPLYSVVYQAVLRYQPLNLFYLSTALSSLLLLFLITIQLIQWRNEIKESRSYTITSL